jgi:hypothetical protein
LGISQGIFKLLLSPDSHWLAYESTETGITEVYVQTFPDKSVKWQVSSQGGSRPLWSRDGKELFYAAPGDKLMAVDVRGSARFEHGAPKFLFDVHTPSNAFFDIARDGKKFLIVNSLEPDTSPPMTVVVNWHAGLKK